jgi:medium-chain acyl-[acyl-carrier-protein] hydrolase
MTSLSTSDVWFSYRRPASGARIRLFCLPYAGGSASLYRQWPDILPPQVEVWPIQLPGRENRLMETPIEQMPQMIEKLVPVLLPYLDKPYAFFGHSMGAGISFELVRALRQQQAPGPVRLFVSGRRAPQFPPREKPVHALPEPEFIAELRRLNGTPEAVLENAELLQLLLPVIRADFKLSETYSFVEADPLTCPITAFGGLQDTDVSREDLAAWGQQTRGTFTLRFFAGDHFFIHSAKFDLLQVLLRDLQAYL